MSKLSMQNLQLPEQADLNFELGVGLRKMRNVSLVHQPSPDDSRNGRSTLAIRDGGVAGTEIGIVTLKLDREMGESPRLLANATLSATAIAALGLRPDFSASLSQKIATVCEKIAKLNRAELVLSSPA